MGPAKLPPPNWALALAFVISPLTRTKICLPRRIAARCRSSSGISRLASDKVKIRSRFCPSSKFPMAPCLAQTVFRLQCKKDPDGGIVHGRELLALCYWCRCYSCRAPRSLDGPTPIDKQVGDRYHVDSFQTIQQYFHSCAASRGKSRIKSSIVETQPF